MPQINLLSNETKRQLLPWEILLTVLVRLFAVVFILALAYYGYLIYSSRSASGKIVAKQNTILQLQDQILNHQNRQELLVRQGQIAELEKLVVAHPYWSKFFPELARVTLRNAYYVAFSSDTKGTAKMSVVVPSYTDFDLFLQLFNLPTFAEQFSDVKVVSVNKYQVGSVTGVKFEVELSFNPEFLKNGAMTQ